MLEEERHSGDESAPGKALPRHPLLQDLYSYRNISIVGLANEQMEMLRHDHIADHRELIFLPDLIEDLQEQVSAGCGT
jgi:hypothetical protein